MTSHRQWFLCFCAAQLVAAVALAAPAPASDAGKTISQETSTSESSASTPGSSSSASSARRTVIEYSSSGGASPSSQSPSSASPPESSSETAIERRGVMGVQGANVFVPKFKERLKNLGEQIELGVSKGWLNAEQVDQFKKERERVAAFEAEVSQKGYPKPEVAELEKQVTALNQNLSQALTRGSEAPKSGSPTTGSGTSAGSAAPAGSPASSSAPSIEPQASTQSGKSGNPPSVLRKPTGKSVVTKAKPVAKRPGSSKN